MTQPNPEASPGAEPFAEAFEEEVSLFELLTPLLEHWRMLVKMALGFGLAAAVVSLLIPAQYTARASFTTDVGGAASGGGRLGGLAGLAAQFGGSGVLGVATPADFFAEVLTSRELLEETLTSKFKTYDSDHPDSVATLLDILDIHGDTPLERLGRGVMELKSRISTRVSQKSGVVTVEFEARSRELAADVANRMVELLNRFNLERSQFNSREQRRFVGQRLAEAEKALRDAEAKQLAFLQENRTYSTSPLLAFEANRLEREVQLRQEVFVTLSREYEQARIAEVRDTPVLTILDRAVPPYKRSSPKRRLIVLVGAMLGSLAGASRIYVRWVGKRAEARNRRDYREFTAAWERLLREVHSALPRRLRGG